MLELIQKIRNVKGIYKMKQKYLKYILIFIIFLMFFIPNKTFASTNEYTIENNIVQSENNFVETYVDSSLYSLFVITMSVVFVLTAYILWIRYGKDQKMVETTEFYPPERYNSAEVNFIYNGSADEKGIISLLIYLADKGYVKIEEIERKVIFSEFKFSEFKSFKITKIKEYDGNNEYEKIFFDGLFHGESKNYVDMSKVIKTIKEAKALGERVTLKDAFEESEEKISGEREEVTILDLCNSFYKTLNKIKAKINSRENSDAIFEPSSMGKAKYLRLMIIAIFILITVKPINDYYGGDITMLLTILLFTAYGLHIILTTLFGKKTNNFWKWYTCNFYYNE